MLCEHERQTLHHRLDRPEVVAHGTTNDRAGHRPNRLDGVHDRLLAHRRLQRRVARAGGVGEVILELIPHQLSAV